MAYQNVGAGMPMGSPSLGGGPIAIPSVPNVAQQAGPQIAPTPTPPQQSVPIQPTPIQISPTNNGTEISGSGGASDSTTSQPTVNPMVVQYIQAARQEGKSDDEILKTLHDNGLLPTNALTPPANQDTAQLHDTGSFLGNLKHSIASFAGGAANAVAHPLDTITNLGEMAYGVADKLHAASLIPGVGGVKSQLDASGYTADADKKAEALGNFFLQRYGSWDKIKTTAYQDPVGFLADASTLLDGIGGGVSAVGDAADISKLGEAGNLIGKAGDAINPLNVASKPITASLGLAKAGLENLGPYLEKGSLRLTPAQKVAWATKLPDIVDYISKYIPAGSPEARFESAGTRVDQFENVISDFIQNDAAGITVSKTDLMNQAEAIKNTFHGERDALEMDRQIDGFNKLMITKYPDDIPLMDIQNLKRSTYKNAFNTAGTKVSDEVEYQIGDLLKDTIEKKTENLGVLGKYPIADINKAYGIALNAKKLLRVAVGRPQVDFVTRLVTDFVGASVGNAIGGPIGGAIGAAVGEFAGRKVPVTAVKSIAGKVARKASKTIPKIKMPAGASTAANVLVRSRQENKIMNP